MGPSGRGMAFSSLSPDLLPVWSLACHSQQPRSPPTYRTTGVYGTDQHGDQQQQEDAGIDPKHQGGAGVEQGQENGLILEDLGILVPPSRTSRDAGSRDCGLIRPTGHRQRRLRSGDPPSGSTEGEEAELDARPFLRKARTARTGHYQGPQQGGDAVDSIDKILTLFCGGPLSIPQKQLCPHLWSATPAVIYPSPSTCPSALYPPNLLLKILSLKGEQKPAHMVLPQLINAAGIDGTAQELIHLILRVQGILGTPAEDRGHGFTRCMGMAT
ncbi:hypothetical protein P7K49_041031 [Saguinus oedipus]|uniref:Uncharacterized protein n=1 Tax=Saguinus oedipus TaxID=9490 RepID=A0ABQ9T8H0_SAGOE|nr:hypothetical protein P7K49_041031 [Saguinus oedipus]